MEIKSHVRSILVFCAAAFAFTAFAEDGITAEKYPDADTVVVENDVRTVYNAEGTFALEELEVEKALTERGRRKLSTYSLDYSRRYEKAEISRIEIVGVDGTVREVDVGSTLRDATDNSSMSANIYDPLDRVLSCSVPGLKIGETRRVYTRREAFAARSKGIWADIYLFQSSCPTIRTRVRIEGPVACPLKTVALRNPAVEVQSSVVTNGERIVYTWASENVPQMFPEPSMPTAWTEAQNLRVSTAADWTEVSRWYWNVCAPHLERTNVAISNKVSEIVRTIGKAAPDHDLLKAVFKFVSQEIRYMGLTMEDTSPGYAPHDVNLTFDNRYGVCRDKAALLVTMLRIAGFDAYPVLIRASRSKMDAVVPSPYFNHAVAAVREDDDYILMDPTDESSRDLLPSYQSDCSYLVATPEGVGLRTSPVPPPEGNVVKVEGKGTLAGDGSLLAEYSILFCGLNDNSYRRNLLSRKPEERRKAFEKALFVAASGAELLRFELEPKDLQDTTKELKASLLVRFPEVVLRGETRDELSVPALSSAFGMANMVLRGQTALARRKYPLVISSTASTEERLEIDLARSLGATLALPEPESIKGKYAFDRSFERNGDTLVFNRRLSVGAIEFSPEEYLELREDIKRVEAAERENATFAKNGLSDANERIISRIATYDLFGDSSWVSTNTVVKEVLTYKGKKAAAEMKISYNPTWEKVELVSVVVSNRNGTVARAGENEINAMDADWVPAAPRYPASKILVVNLPSVEVGSVISCTYVTTATNAPIPFYANMFFDTFTPTDFLSVRVDGWKREESDPKLLCGESMLPPGVFWRDCRTISSNSFARAAEKYRALNPAAVDPAAFVGKDADMRSIRDWMTKNVRVAGPSFDEIRLEDHVVAPEVVLRERYATRIGYIRTLCALLRGAGYDADIVFASDTGQSSREEIRLDTAEHPNVASFSYALCRVRTREGGFLWWGGETKTYYLGHENEYTPLGSTGFDGAVFLDPQTGGFGVVAAVDGTLLERAEDMYDIVVRENGAIDLDYRLERFGPSAGSERKKYAEMLPELRSRYFQKIVGGLSQGASATRELVTDTEGYPFSLSFSAFAPDMAVISGKTMSLEVPQLACLFFSLTETKRENPIGIGGSNGDSISRYTIRFPEGYTKVEHMPRPFSVHNPNDPSEIWYDVSVYSKVEGGAAVVEIEFAAYARRETMLSADYFALLREWNRIANSKANTTIVVRRP